MHVIHPIPPVFDSNSRILILGSFPSVKSREMAFFYGHPQNRFWKLLSMLFDAPFPGSISERRAFLLEHRVAVWDVIASCEIEGSSDSSIRDVEANDLSVILNAANIERIFVNGRTAEKYYRKYTEAVVNRKAEVLPSTSPANAAWTLERLFEAWKAILPDLREED